jgi:ABC-type multidrug transport system fused ATPase/permease subunit
MRRLIMLYSEDKAVIVIGALLALVASPVEVVQFIYVSLALDDAATDGSKASFSGSIGMLCILYAIAAAAVTLNLMLLQAVGHRVAARVRRSLVASVLRQEVSFLFGHNEDILQQTLGVDVECIRKAVSSHLARWIQACVQVHAPATFRHPVSLRVVACRSLLAARCCSYCPGAWRSPSCPPSPSSPSPWCCR